MGTSKFFGVITQSPSTVSTRSIIGIPVTKAPHTAAHVSGLKTTQPTSIGSLLEGISLPVRAYMSCRSSPWGYFVFKIFISTILLFADASAIASAAFILLSSIAI
jgi:hypothetical protein